MSLRIAHPIDNALSSSGAMSKKSGERVCWKAAGQEWLGRRIPAKSEAAFNRNHPKNSSSSHIITLEQELYFHANYNDGALRNRSCNGHSEVFISRG